MSRVDVVIPCYKYAHFLRGCVESVLSQAGVDVRVLIIDDCSPDNTAEVGSALANEDSRVEFRRHAVNKGHIDTYNEGLLEWADGDYCLLLSADDMLIPGALRRSAALMDDHSSIVMTYGEGIRTSDPERETASAPDRYQSNVMSGEEFWLSSCKHGGNLVCTPTAVVRTAIQKKVGGYRKDLPHTGDMEMWLRLALHGSIGFIDAPQAFYRLHGQNMCVGFAGLRDFKQRQEAFEVLFRLYGDRLPNRQALWTTASRQLAIDAFWSGTRFFELGDRTACRECHQLAAEVYPSICRSASWQKFKLKKLLGPRVCSQLVKQLAVFRKAAAV